MGPREPLAGKAEIEAMFAKLAKHAKPTVEVAPPRPRVTLQWQRPEAGSTGVRTVCENYSCCKVKLDGVWQYEVWTREPLTGGMKQLALNLPSFEEGKKVAQAHADSAT